MTAFDPQNDQANDVGCHDPELQRQIALGLDTVPRLTGAVFMIHRIDGLSYDEIAWRCGISVDEVTLRMADALSAAHDAVHDVNAYGRRSATARN